MPISWPKKKKDHWLNWMLHSDTQPLFLFTSGTYGGVALGSKDQKSPTSNDNIGQEEIFEPKKATLRVGFTIWKPCLPNKKSVLEHRAFIFQLIVSRGTLSRITLFFKCSSWLNLILWCCWKFRFKYAAWVLSYANTHILFLSSTSSIHIFFIYAPSHKTMYMIRFEIHIHIETWYMNSMKLV